MNRAFISLYLVIVLSIVLVGWGADKLWEFYNPEPDVGTYERSFFSLLEPQLQSLNYAEQVNRSQQLAEELNIVIELFDLDVFAKSSFAEGLLNGDIIPIYNEDGERSSYKKILGSTTVIRIKDADNKHTSSLAYLALIVIFYLAIAVAIYVWIWPLSRDLRQLESQTKYVGKDSLPGSVDVKVDIGHRSTVSHLAQAFNSMAERIRELISSHKEMTYAVSHELRTPLARMKFALEMARNSETLEGTGKQLESISKDVAEMDSLINELLAYAGYEQFSQTLTLKPGDLGALVESWKKNSFGDLGPTPAVSFTVHNHLLGSTVYCDWTLMERCLHNLFQNAMKYAESQVVVDLRCEHDRYYVSVEDDGPGIDASDAERVFQAFVRLRKDSRDNVCGFGLGLAIVHRIAKWHLGEVSVARSNLGGAKFSLSWPVSRFSSDASFSDRSSSASAIDKPRAED